MLCVIGWFEIIFWFVFYVFLCVMVLMVVCIEEWYICLVVGLSVLWEELFVQMMMVLEVLQWWIVEVIYDGLL